MNRPGVACDWPSNVGHRGTLPIGSVVGRAHGNGRESLGHALGSGAEGRSRTDTPDKGQRFLRPPRLPFRHFGTSLIVNTVA